MDILTDEFFEKMYEPYLEEIKEYGGGNGMTKEHLEYCLKNGMNLRIINFNDENVGFLLTEEVSEDREFTYLAELYILPEYRRKHIGRNSVKRLLVKPIYFIVLDKNRTAIKFWDYIIKKYNLDSLEPNEHQKRFAADNRLYYLENSPNE